MKIVIQCAGRKRHGAATFAAADGRPVRFVAQPGLAPADSACVYARPDDVSDDGRTWRARLLEYNDRRAILSTSCPRGSSTNPARTRRRGQVRR